MSNHEKFTAIVGQNLNLIQLRGYAPMDRLTHISEADEFDQEKNPQGTQRDLNLPHARNIATYAQAVLHEEEKPGAFPEVLLNIRKLEVLTEIKKDGQKIDFDTLQPGDFVEFSIDVDLVRSLTKQFDPAISRVDGNHRLAAPSTREGEDLEWPSIPFAFFVGLSKGHERALFAAINGNQRRMNTSHLSNIMAALGGDSLLLREADRPLWFAQKISDGDYVFCDRIFFGGSKQGVKEKLGYVPPITLKQLETSMKLSLSELGGFINEFMPSQIEAAKGSEEAAEELVSQATKVLSVINMYWTAVSKAYPEAWAENAGKKKYILFESIGLSAFSRYCGTLMIELMNTGYTQEAFDLQLKQLAAAFPLEKGEFEGIAGGGGATKVFQQLIVARNDDGSKAKWAINNL